MSNIPKKVVERFMKSIPRFQKVLQIAKDRDVNESDTVSVLNDIWGEVFGYDKYLEVTSEFSIRGTYCDLGIKVDGDVQFLIEVKAVGIDLKDHHVKQAIDYGANHGVQWIVLTNGIVWRIYRIRFEQPINFDLVCTFDFLSLKPKSDKDQEILYMLSKEGLAKTTRDDFYEKVQSINRYVIGNLMLAEPVLSVIRNELRKLADGIKIDTAEVEDIIKMQVIKREILEGDDAKAAATRVSKFYKKAVNNKLLKKEKACPVVHVPQIEQQVSVTERLLAEAAE